MSQGPAGLINYDFHSGICQFETRMLVAMESRKKYGIFIFSWIWLCLFLFGQNRESELIFKSPKPYKGKFDETSSVENEQDVKNQTKNPSKFDEPSINDKVTSVKFNQPNIPEEKPSKSSEFDVNKYV